LKINELARPDPVRSVTLGLQIGGESAEVIMMIRTQKALDGLFTAEFKLRGMPPLPRARWV
jgi:hypothetical protein